jgi:hypothetical protein
VLRPFCLPSTLVTVDLRLIQAVALTLMRVNSLPLSSAALLFIFFLSAPAFPFQENRAPVPVPVNAQARLPALVRRALDFVPAVREDQVVMLNEAGELEKYLVDWGYSSGTAAETIKRINHLAEITIDHHFPIFVNTWTWHYRRILLSWERGKFPDQAARVLAADLYHEYRHAAFGEDEIEALEAHLSLLKLWRAEAVLLIADPYIRSKEAELEGLRRQQSRDPRN